MEFIQWLITVILIIAMVFILVIIVAVSFLGVNIFQQKSAYISVDIQNISRSGNEFIQIVHRGGDTAYLNMTGQQYAMGVYVDTTSGSYRIQPPSGVDKFSPGTTLFVYNTIPGLYKITNNPADLAVAAPPTSLTSVRLIDENSKVLLAQWQRSTGGPSGLALSVTGITPASWWVGSTAIISSLDGTGFVSGSAPKLNRSGQSDIPATNITVVSPTKITCNFAIPAGAITGQWNVVVTNPGGSSAMLANGFTINTALPPPTVTSITNTTGYRGWPVIESITGTNFVSSSISKLNRTGSSDIPASMCTFVSPTQLICTYNLLGQNASPPNYNVVVTNPDGRSGMRANYFILSSTAPTISSSTPNSGLQAATVPITNLAGTYFQPGAIVVYSQGATSIPLTGVNVISRTQITGTLAIPSNAPTGLYNVTVTNTDGKTVTRASTFTVNSNAPTVSSITNTTGYRGWPVIERITGTNFVSGATSKLNMTGSADIPASTCTFVSTTQLICTYDLLGQIASPPTYNVVVTNPDGKSGMRAAYFTLSSPSPTITSSTPASGVAGTTVSITNLLGNYFQPGATVTYWRGSTSSIPLNSLAVPLRTQITGSLAIPVAAPLGAYNITVLNPDGQTVTRTSAFTVYANPPPTITGIAPGSGGRVIAVPVIVTGTGIQTGARVRLYNGTTSVYLAPLGTVTPPNQISTTFTVPLSVIPGTMNVRITNTDGQYATLTGGYILLP